MNENTARPPVTCRIKGRIATSDILAFICDVVMLGLLLWIQFRHGLEMMFLIIPLLLIGLFFLFFPLTPEQYVFTNVSLEIVHRFRRREEIFYESVFNIESRKSNGLLDAFNSSAVMVYHNSKGKKRSTLCRPTDVDTFREAIYANCPVFHSGERTKSLLESFLEAQNTSSRNKGV